MLKVKDEEGNTSKEMLLPSRPVSLRHTEGDESFIMENVDCGYWGKKLASARSDKVSKNHDYFHHSSYFSPFSLHHFSAHIFSIGNTLHACTLFCTS